MASFIAPLFGISGSTATVAAVGAEASAEQKRKGIKKEEKKTLLAVQQEEARKLQIKAQDKQKLLRVGAQAQIASTSRGVLGEPITGRRRLSI